MVSPLTVSIVRGVAEAVVLALIAALVVALGDVSAGSLAPYAPIGLLVLRTLEGVVDNKLDPGVKRLSGAPAEL